MRFPLTARIYTVLVASVLLAHVAAAMDWDNSAVIGEFRDGRYFHQDSQKLVAILAADKIKAVVTESGPPVISVALPDEHLARKAMTAAIKKHHLHVVPIHEQS